MDTDSMKRQIQNVIDKEQNIQRAILTCSCFNMQKKASESFSLLHPDQVLPQVIKGRDRIYKFAKEVGNDHILAISKLSGKYAYYIEMKDNKITLEENLLTGVRTA